MATPVSKKAQMDRKSSFLDNVVSEDQQRKEKAKKADKIREKPIGKSVGQYFRLLISTCTTVVFHGP